MRSSARSSRAHFEATTADEESGIYLTQTLHRLLQQCPDHDLTVFNDRRRTVSESADRVARLACGLRKLGHERDDRVALLSNNSDRYHECLLAVPWSDGIVVPLNTRWSIPELRLALEESRARTLVVDEAFGDVARSLSTDVDGLETVIFGGDTDCPAGLVGYEELVATSPAVEHGMPARLVCASANPTDAIDGLVKMTRGSAV